MTRNIIKILLATILSLVFAATAIAEPPGYDEIKGPPSKEQRERLRKRIETLRIWKLTKALDLDEKTAARLFPLMNRHDRERAEVEREIKESMKNLRKALRVENEGKLSGLLEKLRNSHKALQGLNDEEREDLEKILTVKQQARYIIFQQEFNREIRRIIGEARGRWRGRFNKNASEGKILERPLSP